MRASFTEVRIFYFFRYSLLIFKDIFFEDKKPRNHNSGAKITVKYLEDV
jgi:hypothetical protein